MMTMAELMELLAKIGLAALLAGAVGAEREWTGKSAGLRTHMLIAVGSTLLAHISIHLGDGARITAQIVTGVGFLGAGSIMRTEGFVFGLTTAASVWMVAAVGVAVGVRAYPLAVIGAVMALIVLEGYRWLERMTDRDDSSGE
jgi:putative Mg2+ transporter-C (MgtC) family protein